ncbi:hypothetical protein [Plesiocystis pacifica]|uniref:hypothetical protein n=1 Tax=Plesiocystis pacifica TaxID=191768 RepID=UPI0012F8ACCE|nr:hypothetical protein [Plesiocystis pacifica]
MAGDQAGGFAGQIWARAVSTLVFATLCACHGGSEPTAAPTPAPERAGPSLDEDDEALLATLLSEDPGDFHRWRARVWRMGSLRWTSDGPTFAGRPRTVSSSIERELARPVDVVVVDEQGPRILLPLERLLDSGEGGGGAVGAWAALRLVATPSTGDLVMGLRRELAPTPWLTLAAGLPVSPVDGDGDELLVRWSDRSCGFDLDLAIDRQDFGALYEPGPAGPPDDSEGGELAADEFHLAPGTGIYPDVKAREPLLVLDDSKDGVRFGHRVRVIEAPAPASADKGKRPKKFARQAVELRCKGVTVRGWVPRSALLGSNTRVVRAPAESAPNSSCASNRAPGVTRMLVAKATPLFEARSGPDAELIGVTREAVELPVQVDGDGWLESCVPSPWGDLTFRFQAR